MNILISIIVPIYNAGKFLNTCIDSILHQEFTDFELILVDDGSTDDSSLICDEYAQKDSRVIVLHKNNNGVSSARNAGIGLAHGQWMCFIDSDDYVSDNYLSSLFAYTNDGYDIIVGGHQRFEGDTRVFMPSAKTTFDLSIKHSESFLEVTNNPELLLFYFPWGKLFRTDIIRNNKILFNEKMRLAEDTVFVIDYLNNVDKIVVLPLVGYFYRFPVNSGKYAMNYESFHYHVSVFKESLDRLKQIKGGEYFFTEQSIVMAFYSSFVYSLKRMSYIDMVVACRGVMKNEGAKFIDLCSFNKPIIFRFYLYFLFGCPHLSYFLIILLNFLKKSRR